MKLNLLIVLLGALLSSIVSCTSKKAELGTAENPIKFFLVPSVDSKVLTDQGKKMAAFLEANTPYKFKISVPTDYITVVESFGTKRTDIASVNTFGYLLANKKFGAEAKLIIIRYGSPKYRAQIVVRADSGINKIEDLTGKTFAYVDPASTSGYLLPLQLLKDKKVTPKETIFAKKHDNVISMVYQKQVDAGATFYSPPEEGKMQDARRLVKQQYPDVEEKIKILDLTQEVPNDPFVFRKDLPEEMKTKVAEALIAYVKTEEGKKSLYEMFGITDLQPVKDSEYDVIRNMLSTAGVKAEELVKK